MFWRRSQDKDKGVKKLSEKEIQRQLYGDYLSKDAYGIEVMDSTAIVKEKEERPIEEKFDAKIKKEVSAELESLKGEFKHIKEEVSRLKKEKEALEHSESAFKLPFFKTRHLVIIGSIVVLLVILAGSILVVKFLITKVAPQKTVVVADKRTVSAKIYTIQVYTTSKKEGAEEVIRLLYSKKIIPVTLKEIKSGSGKMRYVIYAGEYSDKKEADKVVRNLRLEKQFKDSFVLIKPQ